MRDFSDYRFPNGTVSFEDTEFGEGKVSFDRINIDGPLIFKPQVFEAESFSLSGAVIEGYAELDFTRKSKPLKALNARGAAFKSPFEIKGKFECVPDFRGTRTDHHFDLSGMKHKLNRGSKRSRWLKLFSAADDPEDRARLLRLKELAESNRDHKSALEFSADENRAARCWKLGWNCFASSLDLTFSVISDYGQSIWRPSAAFVVLLGGCAEIFSRMSDKADEFGEALVLAAANSFAFIP